MILDSQGLFSDDQAITASAASTNYIDLQTADNIGIGGAIPLLIQVTEAFDNLTSLAVAVQQDDNSSFSSATTLATATLTLAELVQGAKFPIHFMPRNGERYIRVYYTVTGTAPTAGQVTAGFTTGDQTNSANV